MELKKSRLSKSPLGRGLSSLISGAPVSIIPALTNRTNLAVELGNTDLANKGEESQKNILPLNSNRESKNRLNEVTFIPIAQIIPQANQPRQVFHEQEIQELSESIKTLGVLQPILLRPNPGIDKKGKEYEIVAGERRWRAAKLAGLESVPAFIKELSNLECLELALVENIQREDLNPLELAKAYQRLCDEFMLSQQQVAERVGKERASISNYLRLLRLPKEVLEFISDGSLTMGHAKAILSIKEPIAQVSLAKKAVKEGLSVRAMEVLVAKVVVLDSGKRGDSQNHLILGTKTRLNMQGSFPEITDRLRNVLGTKVIIKHRKSGRGTIEIEYFSEQELDRVVELICR